MSATKKSNSPTVAYHVQVWREGWWYSEDASGALDEARELAADLAERHKPCNVRIIEWTPKVLEVTK